MDQDRDPAKRHLKIKSMFDHETFPNAPITEAIAEFSVSFEKPPIFETLDRFGEIAGKRFPNRRERSAYATSISIKEEEPIFTNTPTKFLAYSSEDRKEVAQVRINGFSYSRLRPYTNWNDFLEKTVETLGFYIETFSPKNILSISLKYVNRIAVSGTTVDFPAYFNTGIHLANDLPNSITDAFYRFSLKLDGGRATVMFATDIRAQTKDTLPLVFDIEVSKDTDTPLQRDAIVQALNGLRDHKNRIFFDSITDKTKEMFR